MNTITRAEELRIIADAVVDFPLPVSPTIASISPDRISNDTSRTACSQASPEW